MAEVEGEIVVAGVASSKIFALKNALHVPSITKQLLYVQKFARENNAFFKFHPSYFLVKDRASKKTLHLGPTSGGLYSLLLKSYSHRNSSESPSAPLSAKVSSTCSHLRLGNPHQRVMHQVLRKHSLPCYSFSINHLCSACQLGKSHKLHLPVSINKSTSILQLLFVDVWGPAPCLSSEGLNYFLVFVDDFSNYIWGFPLNQKSDVVSIF